MKKIKNNEETMIFGGTEMKKSEGKYLLPVTFFFTGLIFGASGFRPAWLLCGLGALLIVVIWAVGDYEHVKK